MIALLPFTGLHREPAAFCCGLFFVGAVWRGSSVAPVGMSDVLREPRFWFSVVRHRKRYRPMRRTPDGCPAACLFLWQRNRRQRNRICNLCRGSLRCSSPSLCEREEQVFSTHNRDAKVAEIPKTAARISQPSAGCPEVRFRKISPRVAPVCDHKFFFSPPCLCAVFGIGSVGIAVLNGSGSLELRRRRVKSANKRYGYAEVHLVDSAIAAVDCLVMGSP